MEAACALTVQAEVLSVALSNDKLEALLNEVSDCPTVTIEVTSVPTQANVHDRAPQGALNAGDSIAFKDLLRCGVKGADSRLSARGTTTRDPACRSIPSGNRSSAGCATSAATFSASS